MGDPNDDFGHELERFRNYFRLLIQLRLDPRWQRKFDASDIVQQTFLEAHAKRSQFRGSSEDEWLAWVRQILAHNLADALRAAKREKRDAVRERSLDEALEASASDLGNWLAAEQSSPSHQADRHERALRLAEELAALPDAQREALVLQYWHGWTLAEIGTHLSRSPAAVAGLLKRGLKQLRQRLQE